MQTGKRANGQTEGRKAFTLVEIIFVIAIIGVLASILLPGFSKIKSEAQKIQDLANLKKYAEAHKTFLNSYGRFYRNGTSFEDNNSSILDAPLWATYSLAGMHQDESPWIYREEHAILTLPEIYVSSQDKYASKPLSPAIVVPPSTRASWKLKNGIQGASYADVNDSGLVCFSFCMVLGLEPSAPDNTPIAFTRGLKYDGTWDETYGVYGSSGGYIAFMDGHVRWFDGKRPIRLLKWGKEEYTSDIREAIPNTTYIRNGTIYDKSSNVNDMILFDEGLGEE